MTLNYFQKGFNYSQDGEGNRLVYHLQGCNLRCPWCANPEGMRMASDTATEEPVEKIVNFAASCMPMFFEGGGVTFSGGEPTLQFKPLRKTLEQLKRKNISTAIETNGTHGNLCELIPLLDQLIIDFKHFNNAVHSQIVGISNTVIKENIYKASFLHKNILIRTPLIHNFNDDDFEEFLTFFKTLNNSNVKYEILPYHEYGKIKWEKLGLDYTVKDGAIDLKTLKEFEHFMKKNNLNIINT